MGSFGIYGARKLLDHLTGKTAFAPSIKVGLSTADPGEDGATLAEPTGNGYARVAVTGATWNPATAADPSVVTNASPITFPEATGAWGNCQYGVYFDGDTNDIIGWFSLDVAKNVTSGDTLSIAAGAASLSLD